MSKESRGPELYLEDILDSIEHIEAYVKGINEQAFLKDIQTQDAVARRLEIIGEAASRVSAEFRAKHPDIPWLKIAGLRNVLAHEYFGVNLIRVWGTVQKDLPVLKEQLKKILVDEK